MEGTPQPLFGITKLRAVSPAIDGPPNGPVAFRVSATRHGVMGMNNCWACATPAAQIKDIRTSNTDDFLVLMSSFAECRTTKCVWKPRRIQIQTACASSNRVTQERWQLCLSEVNIQSRPDLTCSRYGTNRRVESAHVLFVIRNSLRVFFHQKFKPRPISIAEFCICYTRKLSGWREFRLRNS